MASPITTTIVPGSHFGGLKLPSGRFLRDCPDHELRTELHRLGIAGAHSDGKNIICQRYHQVLERVWNTAGEKAVEAWLEQNKEQLCSK